MITIIYISTVLICQAACSLWVQRETIGGELIYYCKDNDSYVPPPTSKHYFLGVTSTMTAPANQLHHVLVASPCNCIKNNLYFFHIHKRDRESNTQPGIKYYYTDQTHTINHQPNGFFFFFCQ